MKTETTPKSGLTAFAELRGRIVELYPTMTKQSQAVAQFTLAHPEIVGVETVDRLSKRLDMPASGIVRFAQALGYSGFAEMKRAFGNYLVYRIRAQDDTASQEIPADDGDLLQRYITTARDDLNRLEQEIDRDPLNKAAQLLAQADTIFVAAQHLAYPAAALFTWTLLQSDRQCVLLHNAGGFALRQAQLAAPGDAALAISFSPYQPSVVQEAQSHAENGCAVVAITDSPLSPLAAPASEVLVTPLVRAGVNTSMTGVTVLTQALAAAVIEASTDC